MNRDSTVTNRPPVAGLQHYLRHRRVYSAVLLCAVFVLAGIGRVITQVIDAKHWGLAIQAWEIIVWESSSIAVILALVPVMLLFDRYAPFTWANWPRALLKHALASVVFSVIHVQAMLLLRKLAYAIAAREYDFDSWFGQVLYEYLKDFRSYFAILFVIYAYRFILLRLQGEASELDVSDGDSATKPAVYPDRFLVRKLDKEFLLAAREIEWLEAQGNYINLHVGGRAYPLRSTMTALEPRLDPSKFIRVHRSYFVNIEYLSEIEPLESGDARLRLRDGTYVQCSRTYRAALKEHAGTSRVAGHLG